MLHIFGCVRRTEKSKSRRLLAELTVTMLLFFWKANNNFHSCSDKKPQQLENSKRPCSSVAAWRNVFDLPCGFFDFCDTTHVNDVLRITIKMISEAKDYPSICDSN